MFCYASEFLHIFGATDASSVKHCACSLTYSLKILSLCTADGCEEILLMLQLDNMMEAGR